MNGLKRRRRENRIGVDLDKVPLWKVLSAYFNAKNISEKVETFKTRHGWHIKIYVAHTLQQNFDVRLHLGDDVRRLTADEARLRRGLIEWLDTLFEWKHDNKGESREKPVNPLAPAFWTRLPCTKRR